MSKTTAHDSPKIDKSIFWPSIIVLIIAVTPLAIWPEESQVKVKALLATITATLGWLYLLVGLAVFGLMIWLAFGRFGQVKLGLTDDKPEFSKPAWLAMLFCAGIGVSIVNWAFVEPIYFLGAPTPLNMALGSDLAVEYALMYPQFHWGIIPWSLYIFPAIPVAYAHFVRQEPYIRFSIACGGAIGAQKYGLLGKSIDIIVTIAILGGIGTSLGLGVPLVSGLFADIFNLEVNFLLYAIVLAIWTGLFGLSVWRGLSKGMRVISDINVLIALVMLALFFVFGPSLYLVKTWVNSFGLMADNFWRMSTWTDPITQNGFPEGWTTFYWGWWFALLPMMGLFVARISKGRTIREVILYGVLFGAFGCWIYFAIWGGYAVHLQTLGGHELLTILNGPGGIPETVLYILHTMPMGTFIVILFALLCFFFLATTLDAAAFALAANCTKDLHADQEPTRINRMFWAGALVFLGVGLLLVGGLKAAQASSVIVAVPMIPVLFLLTKSLLKWLNEDFPHLNPQAVNISDERLQIAKDVVEAELKEQDAKANN